MFDINWLKNDYENTKEKLKQKNADTALLEEMLSLDAKLKKLMFLQQELNATRNIESNEISNLIKNKASIDEIEKIKNRVTYLKSDIEVVDNNVNMIQHQLNSLLELLPNLCDDSVPVGCDEKQNVIIKKNGSPTKFNFGAKPHWELASIRNLFLASAASKLTGSRFVTYYKDGARLYRALQQFTLDENIKSGFVEVLPQEILNEDSLYATGQLPKFKDDLFKLENTNYYLSPTAEVQLTNIYRNMIIDKEQLPIKMTANTSCFRSEAGSAGRDTRGVIRLHQFHKSELVCLSHPDQSWATLEFMTRTAESILEKLKLPYQRIVLCTGDTGFSSAKTYDIEVWLPSYNDYKEISSCSNCLDFQARRAKIRYKDYEKNKLVHTLNGSSLAIDRLWVAVVENYQQADGSIKIPDVLLPYMDSKAFI